MRNAPHRLVFLALLVLAGCGGILPKPAPEPSLYRLTAATGFAATGRTVPVQLVVEAPAVEAALDTTRIALARSPTTLDYFADAAWTDRVSSLLQSLLIESLDNSHRFAAVGPPSGALRGDAVLLTELRHFEASYADAGPPRWRVELTAKLVKMPERTILGTRSFHGESDATRNALPAIVDAADTAWRGVATEIAEWAAGILAQSPR
jgi:cholesterol transport system auxiliary component